MPRTRSSMKVVLGEDQPSEITIDKTSNEPSRKRKAPDETDPEPNKWKYKTNCLRCSWRGIRADRLNAHIDKCRNRPAKCKCETWYTNRYDARFDSCFETATGNDLTEGEWCDLEIQTVKLLYIWDGAPENSLFLFPGRSAKDLRRMSETRWTRCLICNYAATGKRKKCSNCHSGQSFVCGICAKSISHVLCGTKEELIDTHNRCAVDDYFKTCFRYMPESALEKLMFQWNLGHPNVSYAELKPNFDQHEQNVEAAVSILKTPHARQSFLSECRNNRSLTPAWSELLKDLEQLANRNTQSLSSPQDERYLSVNHFIFDRKTFKIKAEEDPKFPSIIVLQGGHSCGFEEAISKLFSVSLGYVSLGYVSLGEHSRKQMKLTMAPRKPGDWAQERLFCKPCRFVASSKDYFVSHNISSHPEKKNPELYDCLICGKGLNINSRQHKCGVSSREIRFGTRDLFMVYWLKFMEVKVDKLRDLLSVWDDLRSPVCSEFRKYLSSRLAIKNPTKPDLIYPLCVLLRRAIRSQEKKENPCLVLQNLVGRTKVSKRTLNILNFIFDVALREQTFLKETRKIHGMQEELEAPKVVGEFGVDILRSLESRYHPEWEQSTEAYGYHRFRSSPMGNAQREAIHVQNQSHEEGTSFNPVDIPSDEDTDSVNGIEAPIDGEDAMSSVIAPRNELGQAESESWFSRGFYLGRESSQAEGNIDDEHDGNNNDENNNYNNGDGSEQRLSNPESSSDQNNGYIDGLKEEHRYYRFINDIDLEAPIEKLKELEKGLTERHLEDLNRHHFDDIDLNLRNLISLKGALKALLETREAVEKSIPKDFSLEWSDQMVDGIDLKTPTEQLKKLKESMDEKQCEDVRCGRYNNLALNAGKLTRFARAMERFVPASERVQEVLATWKSHTS